MRNKNSIYSILFHGNYVTVNGHYLLKSGLHSPQYCNLKFLEKNEEDLYDMSQILASTIESKSEVEKFDLVTGPTIPAESVANCLKKEYIPIENDKSILSSKFRDKNILIVTDICTTGQTLHDFIESVKSYEGNVELVATLIDRTDMNRDQFDNIPFVSGCRFDFATYLSNICPICNQGIPISNLN